MLRLDGIYKRKISTNKVCIKHHIIYKNDLEAIQHLMEFHNVYF